ncbi:MAG: 50S ribosomal protein L25 [Anaerolineales bacterium]|jgi:large subunit ribosomal protein L25
MEKIVLDAENRTAIGKKVRALRREGKLPAIIYGKGIQPLPISLDYLEASKVLSGVTSSHLIEIDVDGDSHNVLVRDRQRDPILRNLIHVDFLAVSMTEKLRTNVMVELVGEAPAATEYGGIVVPSAESLEVESLPENLPEKFVVDISGLEEVGDAIFVRDLDIPDGVEVLTDMDETVVIVTAQMMEEVLEELEEVEAMEEMAEEPEIIERGRLEEEEAAEGLEPAEEEAEEE